jgi:hypothetical protein
MRFFANLNVFFSSYYLLSPLFFLFALFVLHAENNFLTSLFYVPALILAIIWYKSGLSPELIEEKSQRKFEQGHLLIGLINLCIAISWLLPLANPRISNVNLHNAVSGLSAFLAIATFVSWPLLIIGLVMIWSSKAKSSSTE